MEMEKSVDFPSRNSIIKILYLFTTCPNDWDGCQTKFDCFVSSGGMQRYRTFFFFFLVINSSLFEYLLL